MDKFRYIKRDLKNCIDVFDKKIVLLSDIHLGNGSNNDNSLKNDRVLFHALKYYFENDYKLILDGDTFEIAENNKLKDIMNAHEDIMWMLSKFYKNNKLIIIKGNHDGHLKEKDLALRPDSYTKKEIPFLENIKLYNSAKIEKDKDSNYIVLHGHQDSTIYSTFLNKIILFLLKHVWTNLENYLFKDPTKESIGFDSSNKTDDFFIEYAKESGDFIICGHTHSVKLNIDGYSNIGAAVMPRCITCIEIVDKKLDNYKWSIEPNEDSFLFIKKTKLN